MIARWFIQMALWREHFLGFRKKMRPQMPRFWADEMKFYNIRSNTCKQGKMCGHYTQIVWKESVRLGCFRGTCKNADTYITCEYDPPGNYVGEKPLPCQRGCRHEVRHLSSLVLPRGEVVTTSSCQTKWHEVRRSHL
ncbi:hypothetical protein Leryth_004578 [Lithospermum erythrorhizon]|nr:hypothetical protein Leryth_004578 [Lithospermum erythrorhizon]